MSKAPMSDAPQHQTPIAVVGVSALFPGSVDQTGFWRDILAGRDLLSDVPPSHWLLEDFYDADPSKPDKTYARRGAFLPDVDFDPMAWGVPPSIVPQTDTTQLLALIVAKQVLDDACRGQFASMDRSRVSCILGVTSGQELMGSMVSRLQRPVWVKALREHGLPEREVDAVCERISASYTKWEEANFPGLLGNVVAGRVANRLDIGGTNCVTDAACASTFGALSMAVNELTVGQSELVLCGGCDTMNDIFMFMCFSKTPALSPTGDCRPFSDESDGTMLGEGLGMVALKRLADAERDGDRVYAVIRGVGSSSDGRAKSVYAPLPEGQAKAIRRAYQVAGYGPDTVELVEAHGTGTKAGDVAEFEGLRATFDESGRADRQWCALGSVKSQIGHTKSAAGAAGLIKAVLALHHKALPPTIKVNRPNPKLKLPESPFYLNTVARPWVRDGSHPRRASVSSFGFGGSNFHVAVEEYVGPAERPPRLRTFEAEFVLVSAADDVALAKAARAMAGDCAKPGMLVYLARTSQEAYDPAAGARLAVVAKDEAELAEKLTAAADALDKGAAAMPRGVYHGRGAHEGGVGFLFPGQGSQYVGMGGEVAMHFDEARAAWDLAASLRLSSPAVHEVTFPRPVFSDEEREIQQKALRATENAQPALGASSLALLHVFERLGVRPAAVAGHSFGEVMALRAAGALTDEAALRVAHLRGALMAEAAKSTSGAMLAVAADLARVEAEVARANLRVAVANHNAPDQVVLSGGTDDVAVAERALAAAGLTVKRLDVATAFHSPIVAGACGPFAEALAGVAFAAPSVPVFANASAAPYPGDAAAVRADLAAQLARPVRFVDSVEAMYAAGVRTFVEVGAGAVLTGLVGKVLGARSHWAVPLDRRGTHGVTSLHHALARLAAAGVPMQLARLWERYAPAHDPRTDPRPKVTLKINGSNYAKPYPPPGGAKALPKPNPERPAPVAAPAPAPALAIEAPVMTTPKPTPAPVAVTPAAPAPLMPAAPATVQHAWITAYQEAQRQTAEAHAAFQRAMADSHAAFLHAAEVSFASLGAMIGASSGAPAFAAPVAYAPAPVAYAPAPAALPAPAPVAYVPPPAPAPVVAAPPAPVAAPAPVAVAPAPVAAPAPAAPAAAPGVDLTAAMLSVVAQKTGYPQEMIGMDMELEADLGIDSIKRVEILAAMRERAPQLPEMNPSELASLRTIGQIVEYMRARLPGASAAAPAAPAPAASVAPAAAPAAKPAAAPPADMMATMLAVVAQKTGYPEEMIGMDMELEADLGIDSIKRVEILAAVRERTPGLPDLNPTALASLRTVGQIVDHLRAVLPGVAAETNLYPVPPARPPPPRVDRYALRAVPREAAGLVAPGLLGARKVAVTDDATGVAPALVAELRARGVPAEAVADVPADADAVIYLGGLRPMATVDEALAVHRDAFRAAKAVAGRAGAFVTVQDTGGDFGLSGAGVRAWSGGLPGLAKTAAQEWPAAWCGAIDIQRGDRDPAALARALADELVAGGTELEVGLRADGARLVLESYAEDVPAGAPVLARGDVVVASGGARGVTAATLIALAKETGCRLVLLGRTALEDEPEAARGVTGDAPLKAALMADAKKRGVAVTPASLGRAVDRIVANREVRATLDAVKAAGSEARYVAADVADAAAVRAALDEVRRAWGPVAGVVHGAGVLADKMIADKTEEQFDRVFGTKVDGLRALLDATAGDPLKVLCVFSSVAGRCGNRGQVDYAMANEVLNKVCDAERARRGASVVVKSLGWGPWEGGMVTPALKKHFESMGVPLIPLDGGAAALVRELSRGADGQVELVLGGEPRAEALAAPGAPDVKRVEVRVDAAHFGFIGSHEVKGVPVVPAVFAIELFARAARQRSPGLVVRAVRKLQVLKGIRLPRFHEGGAERFVIESRALKANGVTTYAMMLLGADGARHYSAEVELGPSLPAAPPAAPPAAGLEPWRDVIYDGTVLFHGPMFHAVKSVEGASDQAITGTLVGRRELGWSDAAWESDPALLDGGLQLAVLWVKRTLAGASLPTSIGAWVPYADARGPVRATATRRRQASESAVLDVTFTDARGATVGELRDVEVHVLPGSRVTPAA
ncbi:MAG: SDR family oxidoreductase [Polyangiales bacterium]